jgi:Na+/H+-dicarboxylate symporter
MMNELWHRALIAMVLGGLAGYLLGPIAETAEPRLNEQIIGWLALPGNLFLHLLQLLVVPLVVASVFLGIAESSKLATTGRLGLGMIVYFLATTVLAMLIGIAVVQIMAPGRSMDLGIVSAALGTPTAAAGQQIGSIPEIIVGLIATNPVVMMLRGSLLQIIAGSAIFGLATHAVPRQQKQLLLDLFGAVRAALMAIVKWLMRFAPLAVFGLLAQLVARLGPRVFLDGMGPYILSVLAGLGVLLGVYLLLIHFAARRSILEFFKAASEPIMIAFATTSSVATLPVTLKTADQRLGVSPSAARLVLPTGATFNSDGSVVFQTVAVVLLLQVFGQDLTLADALILVGLTFATSFSAPGLPGGAIPIVAVMLAALNLPAEGLAILIGVDRLLDMFRTAMNVIGDMVAATVLDRFAGHGPVKPPG